MFLIRVTHSSGMLEGKYTAETVFPPNDHRNHRPRSWLLNGVKKIDRLRFLESSDRTLGQAALQWLLADERVASTLPEHLRGSAADRIRESAGNCPPLTSDELEKIAELYAENFGVEREEPKFKGTMEAPGGNGGRVARVWRRSRGDELQLVRREQSPAISSSSSGPAIAVPRRGVCARFHVLRASCKLL